MDVDAEFAKLQAEARRELERREAEGEELPRQRFELPEEQLEAADDPDGVGLATRLLGGILLVVLAFVLWRSVVVPALQVAAWGLGIAGVLWLLWQLARGRGK